MDNETLWQQLDMVEQRLGKLVAAAQTAKDENLALKARITKLEEELNNREVEQKRHLEEKEQIRTKVDGLLKKLSQLSDSE